MFFTIGLLIVIIFLAWRAAPREREEDAHVHGAGQVGLLGALALFGVDYFTSYYYATGELMHSLHPFGLEHYGYIAVVVIAIANIVFGALYMYSLGVFRAGGGSFTAALRYLGPFLSIILAVVLLQDYIFTIVVSTLSGVEQLLSLWNAGGIIWVWRFLIGAGMVVVTWFITIKGRGESAQLVFTMLGIFVLLTLVMIAGLIMAKSTSVPPFPSEQTGEPASIWHAMYLLLAASMKGLVALSGLEAMSDGIQFVKDEDAGITKWGKKHLPKLKKLWEYYSGKPGIGRYVQTSFLFYGGLTTLILTYFSIQFNAFDGVDGRSLVGNLAFIGFTTLLPSGGQILFWAYQILAVGLLTSASMTAFQDLQAITWRNVAVGEIPEIVVFRNKKGTFTRPVTAAAIVAILVQLAVKGDTSAAVPYYGVGVFLPIAAMGLAMRQHVKKNLTGRSRAWGLFGTTFGAALAGFIFIGQIVGKWTEGGWVVLIVFAILIIAANLILVSPAGYREPKDIHRIVREKSRVHGTMGDMAEWQSLRIQEYRYQVLLGIARFFAQFGIIKPVRFEKPMPAGEFEDALNHEGPDTFLEQFMKTRPKRKPRLGGAPRETAPEDEQADG